MISFVQKGDFSRTEKFLNRISFGRIFTKMDKYGQMGVDALQEATPKDSGLTASSWQYEIEQNSAGTTIHWYNTNVNKGVNIAVILQYGHGTRNGGYVQGRDYINPAMRKVFDQIAEEAWKEVTNS